MTTCAVAVHEEVKSGFRSEVPPLPGCYSEGETVEGLMANVRGAIAGVSPALDAGMVTVRTEPVVVHPRAP